MGDFKQNSNCKRTVLAAVLRKKTYEATSEEGGRRVRKLLDLTRQEAGGCGQGRGFEGQKKT